MAQRDNHLHGKPPTKSPKNFEDVKPMRSETIEGFGKMLKKNNLGNLRILKRFYIFQLKIFRNIFFFKFSI